MARKLEAVRTGFTDGFEYGLGAELGIASDKLDALGSVGIERLTSLLETT